MKSQILSGLAIAAVAVGTTFAAQAADMPVRAPVMKAPPPVMVPVFSWTGCYIGGHVGGAWADARITDVDAYAAASPPGTVTTVRKTGVFGGGQIGCNWQTGDFVFGIEGDGGYMGIGQTALLTGSVSGSTVGIRNGAYGDITGRLGFAADRALFYAKGGAAFYQQIPTFATVSGSFSSVTYPGVSTGWTAGGGIEYAFDRSWSVKAEYLYFRFQNANFTVFNAGGTPFRFRENLSINTVKLGLNYRFN